MTKRYGLSWSGGKDSTLALDRALFGGLEVDCLFNIYEGNSGLVRFHGVRHDLIAEQARSMDIELIQQHTHPDDYPTVLHEIFGTLRQRGISGIIFGNIHLEDIRGWYAEQVSLHDLDHVEPLWGEPAKDLIDEFIDRGFTSTVTGVDTSRSDPDWLGSRFDREFVSLLEGSSDIDLCGERGEYHTFVSDGPLFQWPVDFRIAGEGEIDGHRFLDLQPGAPRG